MAQSKILLDSCAYFRLAKCNHPLLFRPFGNDQYCLYVLKELDAEFDDAPHLRAKFDWVNEAEYRANRTRHLTLSRADRRSLSATYEFVWDYVTREFPGPSKVDSKIVATALVLSIPVVTDDEALRVLCGEYEVESCYSLDILKLMLECGHININKVRETVSYWMWIGDTPRNFRRLYRQLFGEAPPPIR